MTARKYIIEDIIKDGLFKANFDRLIYREKIKLIMEIMHKLIEEKSITKWGIDTSDLENEVNLHFYVEKLYDYDEKYELKLCSRELSEDWEFTKDVIDG